MNNIKNANNNQERNKKDNEYYFELYNLKFFKTAKDNVEKLELNRENVDFIETALRIDSRYKNFANVNERPSIEYVAYLKRDREPSKKNDNKDENKRINLHKYGSSGYWIKQFIEIIKSNVKTNSNITKATIKDDILQRETKNKDIQDTELNLKTIIRGMVYAIDRENSTHLSANKDGNKVGRYNVSEKIYDYIEKKGIKTFIDNLVNEGNFGLIGYLAVPMDLEHENYHYSFATKFCKYVSNAFCKDVDEGNEKGKDNKEYKRDKYYVYDNVIIHNIEYYIQTEEYKIEELRFNKKVYDKCKDDKEKEKAIEEHYKKFYNCLEKIREKAIEKIKKENKKIKNKKEIKEEINRDEFDHLIWYSNK